jgi:hypothetical protein
MHETAINKRHTLHSNPKPLIQSSNAAPVQAATNGHNPAAAANNARSPPARATFGRSNMRKMLRFCREQNHILHIYIVQLTVSFVHKHASNAMMCFAATVSPSPARQCLSSEIILQQYAAP